MDTLERNISPDEIEKVYERVKPEKGHVFDAKNYLNVRLENGESEKSMKIRLLTIDKDRNKPFERIFMHTVKVPKEVSPSGWKSYICLEKTEGPFSEKLGHKCPFCETNREAYKKSIEAKKEGNLQAAEKYKEISIANKANEVGIIRCIERGHEDDGPKFWKFNIRQDKKDPENTIRQLYLNRKEECQEEGIEPENILDINSGRDLKVTISSVSDGTKSSKTNKTSISITTFGSQKPLSENKELRDKWLGDEKVWSDVFVAKPYEYLEVILDGGVPWFDRDSGRWIPKQSFQKNTGISPEDVEMGNTDVLEAKEKIASIETSDDGTELPF